MPDTPHQSTGTPTGSRPVAETGSPIGRTVARPLSRGEDASTSTIGVSRLSFVQLNSLDDSEDDEDFEEEETDSSSSDASVSDEDSEDSTMSNTELADALPRKTVAEAASRKRQNKRRSSRLAGGRPKKKPRKTAANVGSMPKVMPSQAPRAPVSARPPGSSGSMAAAEEPQRKTSPIHYFFEQVVGDASGHAGITGDKYYRCCHGEHRIVTITHKMRGNTNKLLTELRRASSPMYRLWEILKIRAEHKAGPPTVDELMVARGLQDPSTLGIDLSKPLDELIQVTKDSRFDKPFEQATLEQLVGEWMVARDQPFTEPEGPEFQKMIEYARCSPVPIVFPSGDTIKTRILENAAHVSDGVKHMISELEGKVSLSLDLWSSSNGYAFLAIVMHYVTNDWELGELLIDFRELIGEHSGANIGAAVWKTIEFYSLKNKLLAVTMDNATNNDTMMEELSRRFAQEGILFDARENRIRCLPHIVHLSARELLSILENLFGWVATSVGPDGYQDIVTEPVAREQDNVAAEAQDNRDDDTMTASAVDGTELSCIFGALSKLRKIVVAVRSSPQRRRKWLDEVQLSLSKTESELVEVAKMLILDVRTRWSSTHQMLRRALLYKAEISAFVSKEHDLIELDLTALDWQAIELVSTWLYLFREATTQMSATRHNTLQNVRSIFIGLQDEIKSHIRNLPSTAPAVLKDGLLAAYRKLSDYFDILDQSPFYLWACLLDPRISEEGLKAEAGRDLNYLKEIETSKTKLKRYFEAHYIRNGATSSEPLRADIDPVTRSPRKFDFLKRYKDTATTTASPADELQEYFRQRRASFNDHDEPLTWWAAHRHQFPTLSRLARDILTIPGSAVAVERVFSGGRDTISLRRASLKAETIRTLMLYKHSLSLRRRSEQNVTVL